MHAINVQRIVHEFAQDHVCKFVRENPMPFEDHQYFLIDARLHDGMSGSPVVSKPRSKFEGSQGLRTVDTNAELSFLLGILSSSRNDVDLNVVNFAHFIEEIISQESK